ncbi:LLM class flavin-dependent oxidoreductase [Fictibacillus sp. 18YEL24]|uniref:LLM class flavin-dependent oxidoreductase n=1 Tax=Fictibacillus sp. 18YEL24 TaxID=2745875 RepID=UPI0018CED78A|nr:LLM class flavin-dependent oxidoreductase [Fictibacillus sp. 18YEL24]MBH0169540.1 LLM class flavin-dependent oxidoreductase [Fictibacillus sp. 18YEL24]
MKLSILDQSPISSGKRAQDALQASMQLAVEGEKLGYTRYWIAEHHNFSGLSCSAPEVMLSYIGANTNKMRLGAGAVLLPHYKPYRVAETYNMLATLFPDRIDLGIGRAPGGSAEASIALSGNYLENVRKVPELTKQLLHFLRNDFLEDDMFSKIQPSPVPDITPVPWILGTSQRSADLASEYGTACAFGHFMSEKLGPEIVASYQKTFIPSISLKKANTIVAVSVICAETTEQAEELALPGILWRKQNASGEGNGVPTIDEAHRSFSREERKRFISEAKRKMIIGNPQEVKKELYRLQETYNADEIMIVTITHSYEDRIKSYELIANHVLSITD